MDRKYTREVKARSDTCHLSQIGEYTNRGRKYTREVKARSDKDQPAIKISQGGQTKVNPLNPVIRAVMQQKPVNLS